MTALRVLKPSVLIFLRWLATKHPDLLLDVLKHSILAPVVDALVDDPEDLEAEPLVLELEALWKRSPMAKLEVLRDYLWKVGQTRDTKDQLMEDAALDLGWLQRAYEERGDKLEARRIQTTIDGLQQMRAQMWKR